MLYYSCHDNNKYGYVTTVINVWNRGEKLLTIDEQIEGCIDNKAGYGSLLVANRMREQFVRIREQGFTHADTTMLYTAQHARLNYLHFQNVVEAGTKYGYARFEVGDELPRIESGLKLIKRLERLLRKLHPGYPFENPEKVIEVLKRLRAVEITVVTDASRLSLYCTREKIRKQRTQGSGCDGHRMEI